MHALHLDEVDGELEEEGQAREHETADDGPHEAQLAVAVCLMWWCVYFLVFWFGGGGWGGVMCGGWTGRGPTPSIPQQKPKVNKTKNKKSVGVRACVRARVQHACVEYPGVP